MSKLTRDEWDGIDHFMNILGCREEVKSAWDKIKDDLKPEEEEWEPKEKFDDYWMAAPKRREEDYQKSLKIEPIMRFYWNLEQLKEELNGDWKPVNDTDGCYVYFAIAADKWTWMRRCIEGAQSNVQTIIVQDSTMAIIACDRLNRSSWAKGIF